jgi:hypothetical protein
MGAAQLSPILPTWTDEGENTKVTREGALYLEMAPFKALNANGDATYDWANKKTSLAIGINDIHQILEGFTKEKHFKLVHDDGSNTKVLSFTPGVDQYEGTWLLNLSVTAKDAVKGEDSKGLVNKISLSMGETIAFGRLLSSAVSWVLGWPT